MMYRPLLLASAACMIATPGFAQDGGAEEAIGASGEIVVTAQRRG